MRSMACATSTDDENINSKIEYKNHGIHWLYRRVLHKTTLVKGMLFPLCVISGQQ